MYYIIATGFNCADLAKKFIESAKRIKSRQPFKVVLCSDGSTDGTTEIIEEAVTDHPDIFIARSTSANMGAAYQRHMAIINEVPNEDDVIIFIGLDDEIFPNAITRIHKEYEVNGKWMTYGNWVDEKGHDLRRMGFNIRYAEDVHDNRSYRSHTYRATALNTFKRFLYDRIPEKDLQINGQWITTTTESEVMFSCLEMCGKNRIGVIYDHLMLYNRHLPKRSLNRLGDKYGLNIGREYKYQILDIIKSRPKRDLLVR